MIKKIAVVTGTRAEYGILRNTMYAIQNSNKLELQLIVTGMHLSSRYGMTINEIVKDGFKVDAECPILMDYNGKDKNAKEMAMAVSAFADVFKTLKPDLVLILGDRYEILAVAVTALTMNIPIAHISGGEVTEGAMDEQIRHAITKIAHIHFAGTELFANNIKNMGEEAWRVFNVGEPGIENIITTTMLSKEELRESLGVDVDEQTMLVTYHPVTLEVEQAEEQARKLVEALGKFDNTMIITYPNSDNGGDKIIQVLEEFANGKENICLVRNLGSLRYLSVMQKCGVVIGNSSSALIEAPFLKKPVVNIGNRQKGRLMAENIIQVSNEVEDIYKGIEKAMSSEFKVVLEHTESLYGEGNTSKEIVEVLENINFDKKLMMKKLTWN